ncbi:hypothetical protein QUA95_16175 [Microcoleus sp. F10_A2]|uniref:hypothetical protein n=1 Tax=Microcoleus sp. F10_A2 TaxID=3055338 RepID=UPI002FCFB8D9
MASLRALLLLNTGREAYKTASYPISLEVVREPSLTKSCLGQGLEFARLEEVRIGKILVATNSLK